MATDSSAKSLSKGNSARQGKKPKRDPSRKKRDAVREAAPRAQQQPSASRFEFPVAASVKQQKVDWLERPFTVESFFLAEREPTLPWTGSRRLLLGVLQDALRSLFQYRSARSRFGKRLFHETQAWVWAVDQDWLYSFENICAHLRLDPNYIRQGLQQLFPQTRDLSNATDGRRSSFASGSRQRSFRMISGPGSRVPSKPRHIVS